MSTLKTPPTLTEKDDTSDLINNVLEKITDAKKAGHFLIHLSFQKEQSNEVEHVFFTHQFPLSEIHSVLNKLSEFLNKELRKTWENYEGDDKPSTIPRVGYSSEKID